MARRPPPGRCVHCLGDFALLTWDHVLPVAWYFKAAPPDFEKWKVPSCEPCNASHGKLENDLLVRLGLCLDPNHPDTGPIARKAIRALMPSEASSSKDAAARDAKRRKVLGQAQMLTSMAVPSSAIYPGFGPPSDSGDEHTALAVPKRAIEGLAKKIVRGVTYLQDRRYIEPPYEIKCYVLREEDAAEIFSTHQVGPWETHERGPALLVQRKTTEDRMSSMFRIEIWSRLRMYAVVEDPHSDAVA